MAVAVVNPRMVRRFAEAIGRFEKTDRIDARLIAHPPPLASSACAAALPCPRQDSARGGAVGHRSAAG
jgi:transposase